MLSFCPVFACIQNDFKALTFILRYVLIPWFTPSVIVSCFYFQITSICNTFAFTGHIQFVSSATSFSFNFFLAIFHCFVAGFPSNLYHFDQRTTQFSSFHFWTPASIDFSFGIMSLLVKNFRTTVRDSLSKLLQIVVTGNLRRLLKMLFAFQYFSHISLRLRILSFTKY